ncbi:MAG: sulfatase-like hydrolase/transferase [Candidatus Solibacter sp.]
MFQLSNAGAALALANLYLLAMWDELQDHWFDYFRDVPFQTWRVLGDAVLDLLLLALLLWPLLIAAERVRQPVLRRVFCGVLLAIVLLGLDVARVQGLHFYGETLIRVLRKPGLLLLGGIVGALLAYLVLWRDRMLMKAMRNILLFLLPLVPINLATVVWAIHSTWTADSYRAKPSLPLLTTAQPAPRFVWIIFDEWDQYLTFQDRAKGLALPEIDRFRAESLHAEIVFSPAHDTQESLPSLLSGRIVESTKRTAPNELLLTYAGETQAVPWSRQPNIFQDLRQLGVNAALTGFFHPYPRVLGGDVVESFSISSLTLFEEPAFWSGVSGLNKVYRMAESPLHRVPLISRSGLIDDWRSRQTFKVAYLEILDRALRLAQRPEIGLALLHLPVPHPPAIYDRKKGELTAENSNGGYTDNLALADVTLGKLRKAMEAAGQWDNSFVLLTSDHPLRGKGPKHPWIPFLLKTPGQKVGLAYQQPFNSVLTHDLILAVVGGEVHSPDDVSKWLDRERLRYPTNPVK